MGFSYSSFGLCCDFCGKSGSWYNVRKINCPYGYCQAWACCKECKLKKLHLYSSCSGEKKLHKESCKFWAEESRQKETAKQRMLDAGYYLRCAALSHGDKVKVLFRNKENQLKAFFMTHDAYDKIPLGVNATPGEYDILEECKNTDIYQAI